MIREKGCVQSFVKDVGFPHGLRNAPSSTSFISIAGFASYVALHKRELGYMSSLYGHLFAFVFVG